MALLRNRRLRSFDVCRKKTMDVFYQSVVASVHFYAVVFGGLNMTDKSTRQLDKLVKRAGSVLGMRLDSLGTLVGGCTWSKGTGHPGQWFSSSRHPGRPEKHLQRIGHRAALQD